MSADGRRVERLLLGTLAGCSDGCPARVSTPMYSMRSTTIGRIAFEIVEEYT
jgi:hypothetical protein